MAFAGVLNAIELQRGGKGRGCKPPGTDGRHGTGRAFQGRGQDWNRTRGYALGGQAVLRPGEGASPTVAASYLRQVYGGSAPDLDLGSPTDSVIFLASADVWGFHYDTNAMFNRMMQNGVSRPQFGQTLSVSHPLSKQFSLSGELWHFTQPFLHGRAVGNLWALGYTPQANLVWDAGFQRGLTGTSTHWEAFVGFTYLLPHRLWRQTK